MVKRASVRDERGQILILTALSMTVLLGMAALSIDASFMYDKRNRLFAAADGAAKTAAMEVHRRAAACDESATLQNFGNQQAVAMGFTPGAPTVIEMHCPPSSGPFAADHSYVEAIASESTDTFFGRIIGWTSLTPGGRAVAGTSKGLNCLVVLGPGSLSLGNGTSLTLDGCSIADGGNLDLKPGSSITADSVTVSVGGCLGVALHPNAPGPTDPLINLPPPSPAPPHACSAPLTVNADITINVADVDNYYCGMTINNAVVTFSPGVYFIAGPVTNLNGGSDVTVNGSGVMFYLAPGGSFNLGTSNHVAMNLSAPTSGAYDGILFYQDRSNSTAASFSKNNGDNLQLSGALYFPAADVELKNNNGLSIDCALIVVKTITFNNNTNLSNACTGYGGSPIFTISMAEYRGSF